MIKCATTNSNTFELLKLMVEWKLVSDNPWNSNDAIASGAKQFFNILGLTLDVEQDILNNLEASIEDAVIVEDENEASFGDISEDSINKVIDKITEFGLDSLTEEELHQAKQILINSRVDNFSTNRSMAATFIAMDRYNLGDDYFDKRVAVLKSITLEQVKKAAHKVLNSKRMITLQIGRL